jgi:short-chain fatty acids transporter
VNEKANEVCHESILNRMGNSLSNVSDKVMPSPLIFALLLTFVSFILGLALTENSPLQMINHWYAGFWNLLAFGMQMALILVTGHALTRAPQVNNLIKRLAGLPNNNAQAAGLTALIACLVGYFHWGFGLIVGALFAVEVAKQTYRKGIKIHYPLIAAAGYTSQLVWHIGPSTSAGLLSATPGHIYEDLIGIVPLTESVFSIYAILLAIMLVIFVIPISFYFMAPKGEANCKTIRDLAPKLLEQDEHGVADDKVAQPTFGDKLDHSRLIAIIVGVMGLIAIVLYFIAKGFTLDLNIFNFIFLVVGFILHGTPTRYANAIGEAVSGASGIILQFPFYAGIMGMIQYSGLAVIIANWFLGFATATSFPIIAWLTASVMNIFVPSGGGEWAVIGSIMSEVSLALGVPIGKTIVAYGCGDMWTNMLQPFWAIALLGITQLRARDIIGYTVLIMLITGPFIALGLYFFPY